MGLPEDFHLLACCGSGTPWALTPDPNVTRGTRGDQCQQRGSALCAAGLAFTSPCNLRWRKINLIHTFESSNLQKLLFSAVLCSRFDHSPLPSPVCSAAALAPASALLGLSIFLSCHGDVSHLICDLLSWGRVIAELCASRPLVTLLKLA